MQIERHGLGIDLAGNRVRLDEEEWLLQIISK